MRRRIGQAAGGVTLIELAIALAILAILGVMGVPSFADLVARQRLHAAAHHLQADLALARQEAGRQALPVHLGFQRGGSWCYAVRAGTPPTTADCAPGTGRSASGASLLRAVHGSEWPGVRLVLSHDVLLDPQGRAGLGAGTVAQFALDDGRQLQVRITPLGRTAVCAPAVPIAGMPPCPAGPAG